MWNRDMFWREYSYVFLEVYRNKWGHEEEGTKSKNMSLTQSINIWKYIRNLTRRFRQKQISLALECLTWFLYTNKL